MAPGCSALYGPAKPARRLCAGLALAFLVLGLAPAFPPTAGASPIALDLDFLVSHDDFERNFPGTVWAVGDSDPASGLDYWGSSSARTFAGNGSAWSSQVGNRTFPAFAFSENFDGNVTGWTFAPDTVSTYGDDHWGLSSARSFSPNRSVWCAQVGRQVTAGANNSAVRLYDSYMNASFSRSVNLTGWTSATLEYRFWLNSQANYDWLYAAYDDGGWVLTDRRSGNQSAQGWQTSTVTIPTMATRVGFFFISNSGTNFEGAYIDDVSVYGTRNDLNSRLATYDSFQNSTMTRGVDVDAFASARVEYRYWLEPDSANETLEGAYFVGGNWTYTDLHTGGSAGWRLSTFSIPVGTALIGFRFTSDGFGTAEGAYIDDVKVWGTVRPLTCSAAVDQLVGTEALTGFLYTVSASEGLRPYTWSWTFTDGTTASIQNPLHYFAAAGTYTGTATVTDAAGQSCAATTPSVTVGHDTTAVSISPPLADVVEGQSLLLYGADGRGHPFDLDWSVDPPSCGSIDVTSGRSTTFTASAGAGGSICAVRGGIGSVGGQATLIVLHDTSSIALTPATGTLAEGGTQALAAVDASGHALDFQWSTTCGVVAPDTGPSTVFSAVTTGGALCTVTAASGGGSASAALSIVHDTSAITVSPPSAALLEGAQQRFSAVDKFSHAFDATWSLAPASCGSLTALSGASTTLQASVEAGGTTCTVTAAFGADRKDATVTVGHDLARPSLVPVSVSLFEGGEQAFEARDTFGHPVAVGWVLSPSSCGSLSALSGPSTTVRTSPGAGDSSCTLTAAGSGVNLGASVSVLHGAPAFVRVLLSAAHADEGSTVTVTAEVLDGANHTLQGLAADWSATCGAISTATGASKTWSLPKDAGGTSCTARATHGALSGSATLEVRHGPPYTIVVDPPNPTVGAGGSQVLTAKVSDAQGHVVPDMAVLWSASCGAVSPGTGPTTTYTAPGDLGGAKCAVSAVVADGLSQPTTSTLSSPMSLILPVGAVAPGLGIVLLLLVMRRRRREAPVAAPSPLPSLDETPMPLAAPAPAPSTDILVSGSVSSPRAADAPKAMPPAPAVRRTTAPAKVAAPPEKKAPALPALPPSPPKPIMRPVKASTRPSALPPPAATLLPEAPSPPAALPPAAAPPPAAAASPAGDAPVSAPCPQCGKPVEVGWAACPECGLDLVWN